MKLGDVNDVMPRSNGLILNKSSELRFGLRQVDFLDLGEASPVMDCGVCARWLSQWVESWRWTNSQHRKIVSVSPRVENLNLKKVIKVSYLNQESCQCFASVLGFPMYISRIRILVVCYTLMFASPLSPKCSPPKKKKKLERAHYIVSSFSTFRLGFMIQKCNKNVGNKIGVLRCSWAVK